MAVTAVWPVKDNLKRVLNYAMQPSKTEHSSLWAAMHQVSNVLQYTQQSDKTEQRIYVTGIHCDPASALEEMTYTKLVYGKTDKNLAFHAYQSFAPGEVTPDTAHEIGVKLAQTLWGSRVQVVVSTHLDRGHLHNHFVLNSVSYLDGGKYYDTRSTYATMRRVSDQLCREYALSVVTAPGKGKHYAEWKAEQDGKPTWRSTIRSELDEIILTCSTWSQFIKTLQQEGFSVKTNVKYVAIRPPGKERFMRLKTLGAAYTEEAIKERILQNIFVHGSETVSRPLCRKYRKSSPFPQKTIKLSGLRALYFHYLYRMGILPRKRPNARRKTHYLLKSDMQRLDEIVAQTKLLCTHKIETTEQLFLFETTRSAKIGVLSDQRKKLYSLIRRCEDAQQKMAYKYEIAELSQQITALRKEVVLCKGIQSRSNRMKENLRAIHPPRKEEQSHEHGDGCSRPGHENDIARH